MAATATSRKSLANIGFDAPPGLVAALQMIDDTEERVIAMPSLAKVTRGHRTLRKVEFTNSTITKSEFFSFLDSVFLHFYPPICFLSKGLFN